MNADWQHLSDHDAALAIGSPRRRDGTLILQAPAMKDTISNLNTQRRFGRLALVAHRRIGRLLRDTHIVVSSLERRRLFQLQAQRSHFRRRRRVSSFTATSA